MWIGIYSSEFALIPGPYHFFVLRPPWPWSGVREGGGVKRKGEFVRDRERGKEAVVAVREVWQRVRRKEDEEGRCKSEKERRRREIMLVLPWLYGHCVVSVLPCTLYGAQVFLGILCRIHIQPSRSFSPCFCARFVDSVRTKRFHGIKFRSRRSGEYAFIEYEEFFSSIHDPNCTLIHLFSWGFSNRRNCIPW